MQQQRYVAGFALAPSSVLLVRKTHPAQLAGRWNAVGGKVDAGETDYQAMVREFKEETGLVTFESDWQQFCTLRGQYPLNGSAAPSVEFDVVFYYLLTEERDVRAFNDVGEELFWHSYKNATDPELVLPNVTWLLPMARSFAYGERAAGFVVEEQYASSAVTA